MFRRIHQQGLSLVESLATLVITSLTIGITAPSMTAWRERAQVDSVAGLVETDLQLARTSAIARNQIVHFTIGQDAAGSCYVIHTGGSQDCTCSATGTPQCVGGAQVLRLEHLPANQGAQLQANVKSMGFEPLRGMVTPTATLRVTSLKGRQVNLVINVMGRVRSCSPTPGSATNAAC